MKMKRLIIANKRFVPFFLLAFLSLISIASSKHVMAANGPTIDVWYGLNQSFGHIGTPQNYVNIFGNVSDPQGIDESKLTYKLNGGAAQPYSIGPDDRRLAQAGDFNIDIENADLNEGNNTLVITAVDNSNNTSTKTVTINFTDSNTWPTNYTADWSSVSSILDVAQVIDGNWQLTGNGVRPTVLDYDRLIGIGDVSWTDYTAVVPVTIHGLDTDPGAFQAPSNSPGIGLLTHWQGHYDMFGSQPNWGWDNIGALTWYSWTDANNGRFQLIATGGRLMKQQAAPIQFNQPYWMKVEVETRPGQTSLFRFKMWLQSEAEPTDWSIESAGRNGEPGAGSLLLVAHHVDATFGNVVVNGGSSIPPTESDNEVFLPFVIK